MQQEWRAIGALMGYAAVSGALAMALAGAYLLLSGAGFVPIYGFMFGVSALACAGFWWVGRAATKRGGGAVPKKPAEPVTALPPGAQHARLLLAGLGAAVIVLTGSATAVGLQDAVWLGLSVAAAAVYAGASLMTGPRRR